jgi:hypothetical protein
MANSRHSSPIGAEVVPFRHLVLLLCTLIAAVAATPVAVGAAGQLMSIVDSDDNADEARVDNGKLRVGDGAGPLTVNGTVTTLAGPPRAQGLWNAIVPANQWSSMGVVLVPSEQFSISAVAFFGATGNTTAYLEVREYDGSCLGRALQSRPMASLTAGQTVELTFPEGLTIPFQGEPMSGPWCMTVRADGAGFRAFRLWRKL